MKNLRILIAPLTSLIILCALTSRAQQLYHEQYRPQYHFSPKEKWINDPNGMVYYKGIYHLFFQYYPDSTIWGPMHWGHATSKDLIHWQQQPVALYPDSLGYIFSGSAVNDKNNTSGFGSLSKPAMVAIYTNHDPVGEKTGRDNFQTQSIAYSLDEGKSWTKYAKNPVVANPGIRDFRDPKVIWFEPGKKWIMTLATKDRITFYSSPNLKDWKKESDFGKDLGAHGGVWECPDLFSLDDKGKKVWVLLVNLNPGGPNKGSATQYFLGNFDGKNFRPFSTKTKWLDYGPDEYAGVTWSNTGSRKIFIGWMSNWMYANQVPSVNWRNAMTIPRELNIKYAGKEMYVASEPVSVLGKIKWDTTSVENFMVTKSVDVSSLIKKDVAIPYRINFSLCGLHDFSLMLSNDAGEKTIIGYDKKMNQYFIDRTLSGKTDFHNEFAARHTAPRLSTSKDLDLTVLIDASSAELFADKGLSVMTEIFFPGKPYNHLHIETTENLLFKKLQFTVLQSIWP